MTVDAGLIAAAGPGPEKPEAVNTRGSRSVVRQAVSDTLKSWGARFGLAWIAILVLAAVFAPFIASSYPLLVKQAGHVSSPAVHQLQPGDVTWLVAFIVSLALVIFRPVRFGTGFLTVIWFVALAIPLTAWPDFYDGWRPGGETMTRAITWTGIALAAIIVASILIALPLLSKSSRKYKLAAALGGLALCTILILFPLRPRKANVYEEFRDSQRAGKIQWMLPAPIPFSPNDNQRDDVKSHLQPPSRGHWMGTEQSGADVFSRMLHASRIALSVGFIATGISVAIGVFIGGLMGYFVGIVDIVGMRIIEIFEAIPTLILLLTVSAFFGRNLYLMMSIIGLLGWTTYARFIRADFLGLRRQDFVQAAIAAGLPLRSIIFRHMLPNGITAVLVNTSFGVANAILIESTLSFLGLGLVDEPSWGQLLNQARAGGTGFQWWIATFPGVAIFLTVFAYNLIGEAIRDAIDPRLRKRD